MDKKKNNSHFLLFVENQGTGAARIIVIILKVISLSLTSIFGLCMGILAPLAIWNGDFEAAIAESPAIKFWFASSIIYIIGTVILMLGYTRIAAAVHAFGSLGTLITYYFFMLLFADVQNNNGPSALYMPCLFITVISVIIVMLIHIPKWLDKKAGRENQTAPSILSNDKED